MGLKRKGMTKRGKSWLALGAVLLTLAIGAASIVAEVRGNGGAAIYTVAESPSAPVAIVFGAGYNGKALTDVLFDRVTTGVQLYKTGKVHKLLMTGDNGRVGYSEPDAMKAAAVERGVPAKDIYCDYAGFHTYDSLYRARDIFGVKRAILVTQTYHLHRALYIGRKLGLDVDGVAAEHRLYVDQGAYNRREIISTIAAWIDVNLTHPLPRYLGNKEADLGE